MTIDDTDGTGAVLLDGLSTPQGRPRPWFLGSAPTPTQEPTDRASRTMMMAELAQLPLFRTVRQLVDFIGDGLRITKQGELFAVDRRKLERQYSDSSSEYAWGTYGITSRTHLAWTVLTRHGWLVREEGWVRPTGRALAAPGRDDATERDLDGARSLLAAALDEAAAGDWYSVLPGGFGEDVLDALLVASGSEGLTLPNHPVDGVLLHCCESVRFLVELLRHPHIHDVPLDRRTGHVADGAVLRIARVSHSIDLLISSGLVIIERGDGVEDEEYERYDEYEHGENRVTIYRTPTVMRGAIALVRERRSEESLPR